MKSQSSRRVSILIGAVAGAVILVGVGAPVSIDFGDGAIGVHEAFAKGGNGGGGNGGNGPGNGAGNGGGSGNGGGQGASASAGPGNGQGNANGHGKGVASVGHGTSGFGGEAGDADADALGSLNAAHASPNALAHASRNSRVGAIAAYSEAVQANDIDAAATAFSDASNKDEGIVESVVHAVNALLGIDANPVNDPTAPGPVPVLSVHDVEPDVVSAIQGPAFDGAE
jgi:hypothetical protein